MSKLDEVKEILSTLRLWMSISIGVLVVLIGGLVNRFDKNLVDAVFFSGILLTGILLTTLFFILRKISEKTKELGDL
ncbi:MAG: hypothetical protein IBX50_18970 [Marinospirillum sp.]|uniref:hypothetical protein n=1 Tax=Marinospirillum sp. TaxID=2183934 RepID=UPI0019E80A51|nr:hypothetical protein [Marinospirillum sp.]MBE0508772.1 hypothetical protein [Marinospirillum sp.]